MLSDDSVPTSRSDDSLLLGWHLALVHIYDNLVKHPELREIPGIAPLLKGNVLGQGGCAYLKGHTAKERAAALQRAYVAGFPVDSIARAISQTPALDGAVRSAHLTPDEFAAMTSAIQQTTCANNKLEDVADTLYWPVNATLGKNLAYLFGEGKEFSHRRQRVEWSGLNIWQSVESSMMNRRKFGKDTTGNWLKNNDSVRWWVDCDGKEYPMNRSVNLIAACSGEGSQNQSR